eukprot:8773648-Pyramimonas_sp.AAC.1
MSSFYGSRCANNGKGDLNTPVDTHASGAVVAAAIDESHSEGHVYHDSIPTTRRVSYPLQIESTS